MLVSRYQFFLMHTEEILDAQVPPLQRYWGARDLPRTCSACEDADQGLLQDLADRIITEKAGTSWMLNPTNVCFVRSQIFQLLVSGF